MSILIVILGLVAIGWGADRFTDGAGALARRYRVPEIVIGLTIVGFGTSMPEFFVSFVSALEGRGQGQDGYRGGQHRGQQHLQRPPHRRLGFAHDAYTYRA